jgi:oxygen-dependent protoporphyrinogen oxidase
LQSGCLPDFRQFPAGTPLAKALIVASDKCVVVGGGISGLAAAFELHRQRIPFVLLESAPRFGGLIRTETCDGFVIDGGADAILTQKPAGVELCRELGLALSPVKTPGTFIARGSSLRQLPEGAVMGIPTDWRAFAATRAFSPAGKLRIAAEYLLPAGPPIDDESIASFIRRRFGNEALEYLGEPLLAGIHGGDAERLSMRALFPRLLDLEQRHGSVIRGFRQMKSVGEARAASPFAALAGGMETLVDALIAALPPDRLMSGACVSAIDPGPRWRVHLTTGATLAAAAVVLAAPPRVAGPLLMRADSVLAGLCGQIHDVSLVTVALGYDRAAVSHPLRGSGFVVPRTERASVSAVTWASSKWNGRAPAHGALLRGYLGGARDPSAIDLDDERLIGKVQEDLRRFLGIKADPMLARVFRWPRAGVQMEVGHRGLMDTIDKRLDRLRGLFISGAGFRGTGIADCVGDARKQALAASRYLIEEKVRASFAAPDLPLHVRRTP